LLVGWLVGLLVCWLLYILLLCERVLCVSYIRKQIGGQLRPTRQVRRNIFFRGQHGRQRERKFCVRALPASSAGRQIGGQLRPTRQVCRKKYFEGPRETTGAQVLCASSACQFCWQRDAAHINPSQHKFAFQKVLAARPPRRRKNNKTKKTSWEARWGAKVRNRRGRRSAIKAYNAARTPSASAVWGNIVKM